MSAVLHENISISDNNGEMREKRDSSRLLFSFPLFFSRYLDELSEQNAIYPRKIAAADEPRVWDAAAITRPNNITDAVASSAAAAAAAAVHPKFALRPESASLFPRDRKTARRNSLRADSGLYSRLHNGGWRRKSSKVYLEAIPREGISRQDISSIAGIILSRNLVASYNGNGMPGAGKIEGDFYCAIRADIDADIKYTRRETKSPPFAVSLVEGCSSMSEVMSYSNAYNGPNSSSASRKRALSCFLRINAPYPTFIQLCTRHSDTKITDYKSVFYISEACINYIPAIFHIPCL